jgi:hypothetical protein
MAEWVAGCRERDCTPAIAGMASRASIDRRAALVSFCETCGSGIVFATIEVPALRVRWIALAESPRLCALDCDLLVVSTRSPWSMSR